MITPREFLVLAIAAVFLAFSNSFLNLDSFLSSMVFFALILLVYVAAKKLFAAYLDCETEEKIWVFKRYGFREHQYFKTPIPAGLVLAFLLPVISQGYAFMKWFAVTETDINAMPARAARKRDFYSYSELTEWHIAVISSAGIFALLILSFFSYLFGFSELGKLAIFFSVFNMLPVGKLDGTKIFFGSLILYFTLLAIVLIALGYALFPI